MYSPRTLLIILHKKYSIISKEIQLEFDWNAMKSDWSSLNPMNSLSLMVEMRGEMFFIVITPSIFYYCALVRSICDKILSSTDNIESQIYDVTFNWSFITTDDLNNLVKEIIKIQI